MAESIRRLIAMFRHLPGVGEKTATRFVYHIIGASQEYGKNLSRAVLEVVERVKTCHFCGNLTEQDPCDLCNDPQRDRSVICVVEKVQDLLAIEKSLQYRGLYHVLQGVLSPLDGVGPEQLRVKELFQRLDNQVKEIILATGSGVEGEATALYLKKRLDSLGVLVSRIASGVPVGGELEYVDQGTISRALSGRVKMPPID